MDTDGDGIDDVYDVDATGGVDANNDGIDDAVGATDTDNDGTPDYLDIDSDNDGIDDVVEAGGTDADNDGVVDGFTDTDGNGLDDATETTPLADPDTDGTGGVDRLDLDSDADGIPAAIEGSVDTDGDGVPDYLDLDSDNDGVPDSVEVPISGVDSDGDGIDDVYDVDVTGGVDANNDGIDDGLDDSLAAVPYTDDDTDGDGIVDRVDLDSDNDGLPDLSEALGFDVDSNADGRIDEFVDENGDGLDDRLAENPLVPEDTDGNGIPDHLDLDSDNDSLYDIVEATIEDSDNNGMVDNFTDDNGDGYVDFLQIYPEAHPLIIGLPDSDGDGIPDVKDAAIAQGAAESDEIVLTGLSGSGCSVHSGRRASVTDPTLMGLGSFALMMLMGRRFRRRFKLAS